MCELHFLGTYESVVCVPVTMCPPDDVIFNNRAIIFGIVHCRGFYRCNLAKQYLLQALIVKVLDSDGIYTRSIHDVS